MASLVETDMNNFLVDGNTGRVLMQDVRIAITGAQLEAYEKYKKAKSRRSGFQKKREHIGQMLNLFG